LAHIFVKTVAISRSEIPLQLVKMKGQNKRMQSKSIRLIEVIFRNVAVLSVSDRSWVSKQSHLYRSTKKW